MNGDEIFDEIDLTYVDNNSYFMRPNSPSCGDFDDYIQCMDNDNPLFGAYAAVFSTVESNSVDSNTS